ncbi:MAG: hypothetical protein ACPGQS_15060 [Bradymonadia bacterium]
MELENVTRLSVGASWQGAFPKTYWEHFNLLELPAEKLATVKRRTVVNWYGDDQAKTLVVPFMPALDSGVVDTVMFDSVAPFTTFASSTIVMMQVANHIRPTKANRERIRQSLEFLSRNGLSVALSAEGLWSLEELIELAAETASRVVVDPLDEEVMEGEVEAPFYYRIKGRRGFQNQLTDHELHLVHQRVQDEEAYVSFGLPGFWSDALRFNRLLQQQDDFWG